MKISPSCWITCPFRSTRRKYASTISCPYRSRCPYRVRRKNGQTLVLRNDSNLLHLPCELKYNEMQLMDVFIPNNMRIYEIVIISRHDVGPRKPGLEPGLDNIPPSLMNHYYAIITSGSANKE